MAYTPELDLSTVRILRRIAWAMNVPITVALPSIIQWTAISLDSQKIFPLCRAPLDCELCPFNAGKTVTTSLK